MDIGSSPSVGVAPAFGVQYAYVPSDVLADLITIQPEREGAMALLGL